MDVTAVVALPNDQRSKWNFTNDFVRVLTEYIQTEGYHAQLIQAES